jgi:hypothetical protein
VADGPVGDHTNHMGDQTSLSTNQARQEFALGRSMKAESLLSVAAKSEGAEAIALLHRIAHMDLPDSPGTDKMLSEVYSRLGELYVNAPSKQVQLFGAALQYTDSPSQQQALERRIEALGGDAGSVAFGGFTNRTFGTADLCTAAIATATPASFPGVTIDPFGDTDWYAVGVSDAGGGATLRIETISDDPGGFSDDTDLTLCADCTDGSGGGDCDGAQLGFNDDSALANAPFMSRIDTDCLANGTYYLAVGGFADSSGADNFTLEIDVTGSCTPPSPDDFEPDNDRSTATLIGNTTSADPADPVDPDRVKAEIQAHNFFPAPDQDWTKFKLERSELVHIETSCDFPTIFNDFTVDCDTTQNPDTVVRVYYPTPPTYGGLCNQANIGFGPICATDADCPDPLDGPVPGFPPCIDFFFFQPIGPFTELPDQPLITDDDDGLGFGSAIDACFPLTVPRASSPASSVRNDPSVGDFHWFVRTTPFSPSDSSDYKIQVRNVEPCCYEYEDNNDFPISTPMCLGGTVHGIFEFSETVPFQDADLWAFDVDAESLVTFQTTGPDVFLSDTALQLFVGPDNNGDFFFTGISDDDGGGGFLSRLELILPPAADLLGIVPPVGCDDRLAGCTPEPVSGDDDDDVPPGIQCISTPAPPPAAEGDDDDDVPPPPPPPQCPSYYLNVTSFYLNPNFPYSVISTEAEPPIVETEPNDDCATNAETAAVGDVFASSINPTCDYDTYKISLAAAANVSVTVTGASIDTVMELRDCADDSRITCDDDGGTGFLSALSGCLDAGDYCVRIRAFSGFVTFGYGLEIGGGETCIPGTDPGPMGDGLFKCDDVPAGEFDTCP